MTDFPGLLEALARGNVEYVIVGVDLASLIRLKRAAGRPKDLEVIAELEALAEEHPTEAD